MIMNSLKKKKSLKHWRHKITQRKMVKALICFHRRTVRPCAPDVVTSRQISFMKRWTVWPAFALASAERGFVWFCFRLFSQAPPKPQLRTLFTNFTTAIYLFIREWPVYSEWKKSWIGSASPIWLTFQNQGRQKKNQVAVFFGLDHNYSFMTIVMRWITMYVSKVICQWDTSLCLWNGEKHQHYCPLVWMHLRFHLIWLF